MSVSSRGSTTQGPVGDPGGFVGLVVVGLGLYFGYWFITAILPIAWAQFAQLAIGALTPPATTDGAIWSSLARDAAIGFVVGLMVGAIRYFLRIKNEVLEDIVDAMATPDVLSVSKASLGIIWLLWHGIAGAISGFVLGWTGMIQLPPFPQFPQMPQMIAGGTETTAPTAGSALTLLTMNGLFGAAGGSGPPPPDVSHPIISLVVVVVVLLLVTVIGTVVVTAALAVFGKAFASGFVGGFSKHLGINVVLVFTRIWRRHITRWPNPKNLPPLDFEQEVAQYINQDLTTGQVQRRLGRIGEYLQWLQAEHPPVTPANALAHLPEFTTRLENSGQKPPRVLAAFQRYLQELKQQNVERFLASNLDEVAYLFAQHRRRVLERFVAWLRSLGSPLSPEEADWRYNEFVRTLDGSDETVARDFIIRLRSEIKRRRITNEPPTIDGLPERLFYKGWLLHTLGQALWIGCITGTLGIGSSVISLFIMAGRSIH